MLTDAQARQLIQLFTNYLDVHNNMVNEDPLASDDVNGDGTLVYIGYAKNGTADTDPFWKILKVTQTTIGAQVITRMTYPKLGQSGTASKAYVFQWSARAGYTYS